MVSFGYNGNGTPTTVSFDPWQATSTAVSTWSIASSNYGLVEVWHSPRARRFREKIQRWADVAGCSFDEALRIFRRVGEFEVPELAPPRLRPSLVASLVASAPRVPRLMVRTPGRSSRGHDGRRRYRPRRTRSRTARRGGHP